MMDQFNATYIEGEEDDEVPYSLIELLNGLAGVLDELNELWGMGSLLDPDVIRNIFLLGLYGFEGRAGLAGDFARIQAKLLANLQRRTVIPPSGHDSPVRFFKYLTVLRNRNPQIDLIEKLVPGKDRVIRYYEIIQIFV